MTPLTSEAHVPTQNGPQYLADLCRQLEQRAQERPEPDMTVDWNETDGTIELGWARGALRADETGLSLRAEADDEDPLGQVCELNEASRSASRACDQAQAGTPHAVTGASHGSRPSTASGSTRAGSGPMRRSPRSPTRTHAASSRP
jgi:hypothetical protein